MAATLQRSCPGVRRATAKPIVQLRPVAGGHRRLERTRAKLPEPDRGIPVWATVAALRALGFGREDLDRLLSRPWTGHDDKGIRAEVEVMRSTATAEGVGVLVVADRALAVPPSGPYLLVAPDTVDRYLSGIRFLSEVGLIGVAIYERG